MLRIITSILAVIGLVAVLSHPLARQGLNAMAAFGGNIGSTLTKAAAKLGGTGTRLAVSTAPLTGADISALLPEDDGDAELGTEVESNSEPEKDEAVKEKTSPDADTQDDSGAELVKVLEIYKNAERDKRDDD